MLSTTLSIAAIATLAMLSPGPDFFLVVKNSLSYPRKAAMMTALGILVALSVHMSYCVAGLAVIIKTTPWLFNVLKYAGAVYLVWIGIQALLAKGNQQTLPGSVEKKMIVSLKKAFLQGLFCNLLNPKATLFFLAVFTQFLSVDSSFAEKLWVAFILMVLAIIWWPLLVLIIQSPSVQIFLQKIQKGLDKVLGVVLIGFGIRIAFW